MMMKWICVVECFREWSREVSAVSWLGARAVDVELVTCDMLHVRGVGLVKGP